MLAPLFHTWNLNLDYAKRLIADVPDAKMTFQPAPKTNHAAWVIGHLACSCDFMSSMIGGKIVAPKEWETLFGWESAPTADPKRYPSKAELWKALEAGHVSLADAVKKVPAADWAKPFPLEAMRGFTPTLGDGIVFILAAHENVHLGQLSAWRRVQGLPSV